FSKANKEDPTLAIALREREDLLGLKSYKGLAEVRLPLSKILTSAMRPIAGAMQHQDQVAAMMMPGLNPVMMMLSGAAIIVWFLVMGRSPVRRNYLRAYVDSQPSQFLIMLMWVIPGGAWILTGRLRTAFFILSILILLCMPIVAWPARFFILEPS